ncbi:MAG: hypothetical protein SV775_05985 [Thermodesulfobacteriota bacterium]|nr:hypothetical protein [Thermodesulfobacteriota bacterium]
MANDDWIANLDENTMKYVVGLQEINKSLVKTIKIYGELLKHVKFEDKNRAEIRKAIDNLNKVIASAENLTFFQNTTRH